jgi:hypothetical protein
MTVEYIGLITLALGFISLFLGPPFIVSVFLCSTLLGSAAASVLDSLGGTNISPAHLLLAFLAFKLMTEGNTRNNVIQALARGRPVFWLLLTAMYCAISAYFMPRIFAGETIVFPVRSTGYSVPLEPAMSNLTQSIYLVSDFICFVLLYAFASTRRGRITLGDAAIACAVLNLVFAALDLITYWTNTTDLFSIIRNANYSLLNEAELAGFKRIVGSFTEASSFGSTTLGYFAFTFRLWLLGVRPKLSLTLAMLSLGTLIFSTSTTAYVGLALFALALYLEVLIRTMSGPLTGRKGLFLVGAPIAALVVVLLIALNDNYSNYIQDLLDTMVLGKMSTSSGIERASWNSQALTNFFDTFGFGAGNGSLRASSFPVSVLANLGIIGTLVFSAFFISVMFSNQRSAQSGSLDEAYREAAKSVCAAWLITGVVSGALTDLGLPFFAFAALASAKTMLALPSNLVKARELSALGSA